MKKLLLSLFCALSFTSLAHADLTGYNNSTALGRGEEANFANGLQASRSGQQFTIGLFGVANGYVSQVESVAALPTSYSLVALPTSNSVGAVYTLANGTPGQIVKFFAIGRVGSDTAVITPATSTGFSTATLGANNSFVTLQYINSTIGWIILAYSSTAVT